MKTSLTRNLATALMATGLAGSLFTLIKRAAGETTTDIGTLDKATAEKPFRMVWIPGGEFSMGSELPGSRMNEKPALKVNVDGFWLDAHDVTNAEFRKFVKATVYKTTAERAVDWEKLKKQVAPGTPGRIRPNRVRPISERGIHPASTNE